MKTTEQEYSKRKVALLIAILLIVGFVIFATISPSFRREPIPNVPNNYSFGSLAPIISLNQTALVVDNSTTVQVIYLGQKPLLRIENMNISGCAIARVLLFDNADGNSIGSANQNVFVDLGPVRYSTGHTNYELPFEINISQYNTVNIWCDSTNSTIGRAIFQ